MTIKNITIVILIYILCSDLKKLTALIGKSYFLSKSWPFIIYKQPSQHYFHDMLPLKNLHGALQEMYIEICKHSNKNINGWTYLNCLLMTTKTMVNVVINAQTRIDVPLVLRFSLLLERGISSKLSICVDTVCFGKAQGQ